MCDLGAFIRVYSSWSPKSSNIVANGKGRVAAHHPPSHQLSMSLSTADVALATELRRNDGRDAEQILIVDKSRQHFMWRLIHDGLFRLAPRPQASTSNSFYSSPSCRSYDDWLASIVYSGFQLRVSCGGLGSHGSTSSVSLSSVGLLLISDIYTIWSSELSRRICNSPSQ